MTQFYFRRPPITGFPCANTAVLIGHSFVANNSAPDASFGAPGVAPTGVFGRTYSKGILERAFIQLNQPFRVLSNQGVVAENSSQILARFSSALALQPGWIFLDCWSNDPFNSPNPTVDLATSQSNTLAMIKQANAQGIMVALCTAIPRAGLTQAGLAQLTSLANYFKDLAVKTPGLIVLDMWPTFADTSSPAAAYGGAPNAALVLSDGIHPNSMGAGIAAQMVAAQLKPYIVAPQRFATSGADGISLGDPNILNANPTMLGNAGTVSTGATGTVATGYNLLRGTGSISAVGSVINRNAIAGIFPSLFDDNSPNTVQMVALSGAAASTDYIDFRTNIASNRIGSLDGPYVLEIEVGADMQSGTLDQLWCGIFINYAATNISYNANYMADTADYLSVTRFQGVLRTRPFYTPASVTAAGHYAYVRAATSAGATGNLYIGNFALRKLLA